MCHFRGAPDSSHSNISKFGSAVAAVSWVSVFQMCLCPVFWACQKNRARFELAILVVMRHRFRDLQDFLKSRARGPGESREWYCLSVFSYSKQLAVDRLTGGDSGQRSEAASTLS